MVTNKEDGVRDVEKVYTLMDDSKQNWFRTKWWYILDDEEPSVGADYNMFGMWWWNEKKGRLYMIIMSHMTKWVTKKKYKYKKPDRFLYQVFISTQTRI